MIQASKGWGNRKGTTILHQSINQSINQAINQSINQSISPFIYSYLFTYPSFSSYPHLHLIHPYIYLSTYLSVCLSCYVSMSFYALCMTAIDCIFNWILTAEVANKTRHCVVVHLVGGRRQAGLPAVPSWTENLSGTP